MLVPESKILLFLCFVSVPKVDYIIYPDEYRIHYINYLISAMHDAKKQA